VHAQPSGSNDSELGVVGTAEEPRRSAQHDRRRSSLEREDLREHVEEHHPEHGTRAEAKEHMQAIAKVYRGDAAQSRGNQRGLAPDRAERRSRSASRAFCHCDCATSGDLSAVNRCATRASLKGRVRRAARVDEERQTDPAGVVPTYVMDEVGERGRNYRSPYHGSIQGRLGCGE
jgi:hypothetical protein